MLSYSDLIPFEGVIADAPVIFPYIPGLLAFREGPAVLAAWNKLQNKPDLRMFDSPGHLMDVEHATELVRACCAAYRLPEPTRWAHKVAGGEKLPGEGGQQPRPL